VPSHTSNRSTKRSNLIRERPLTNRRDLIRLDFRGAGIQFATPQRFACSARELFIPHAKPLEVCFFKLFKVEQCIVRAVHRANQLVEFELDGVAIAVLGVLNQKNHQECDDRRACVDNQLPRIAELEYRACDPQTMMVKAATMNAAGWPVARAVDLAKREKGDEE
jgi:hypothetical protein